MSTIAAELGGAPVSALVSVVMLVRDRLDYTRRAIESLARCEGDLEFIIIDNGSQPDTGAYLSGLINGSGPAVTLRRFDRDPGGSSARNAGAAAARGEFLFFVDNDVVADDPALVRELVEVLRTQPDVAAVSPLLLYPGTTDTGRTLVQCAGGGSTADGRIGLLGRGEVLGTHRRALRDQSWAPTAALLVRRSSFLRAAGFDVAFDPIALLEDVDLCCRLRAAGERIVHVGAISMRHYEGMTFNHLGYAKLAVWKRHTRVVRARWAEVFAAGPCCEPASLNWVPIEKDYRDLDRPRVRVLAADEPEHEDTSFFASRATLPRPDGGEGLPIRLAVLGCGQAALRGALPALATEQRRGEPPTPAPFLHFTAVPGTRVTAVADPGVGALLRAARWYGVAHALRDPLRLLETVPLEGAVVCAPPAEHATLVLAALRQNLSVLVEKPAACDRNELDAMLAALAQHPGLHVAVNLPWGFHPGVGALTELIAGAAIGTVESFELRFGHTGPQDWAPRAGWYRDAAGGVVTDLGLHALDVAGRMLGGPLEAIRLETVTASGWPPQRSTVEVVIAGVHGLLDIGWDAPGPEFALAVHGSRGSVRLPLVPFRPERLSIELTGSECDRRIDVPLGSPDGGPYAEFVAALRGGAQPRTSLPKVAGLIASMLDWSEAAQAAARPVGAAERPE